jgi:hypothetical protein
MISRQCVLAALLMLPRPCAAQPPGTAQLPMALHLDSVLYGDNTEFPNRFRRSETILGSFQRVFVEIAPSDRAIFDLGVYALERAGSHAPIDRGLPIVTLSLGTARDRFIFGTLDSPDHRGGFGPDRTTPHGLLPPLAVETLWFTRSYEAGIQWLVRSDRITHDGWFDFEKLNTPEHREKMNSGGVGRLVLAGPFGVGYQIHIVHHGGEQYHVGPVADSFAYGAGFTVEGPVAALDLASAEVYAFGSLDRPDRAMPALTTKGRALFTRAAVEKQGWRAHVILWRASDFNHEGGDPNYLSTFSSGSYYRDREYAEIGISRLVKAAPSVDFEGSFRAHWVQGTYSYSYRMLAIVHLKVWQAG